LSIANPYLHGTDDHKIAELKKWAAAGSMSVAVLLVVTKLFAFLMTDSVSVLSTVMDSAFDAFASLMTMLSIMHAATPADEEHRYGHGKLEALSALVQAVFVFGSAVFLVAESVHRFIAPQPVHEPTIGIIVMVASIVMTGILIVFQLYVIRKTGSVAIKADHTHYRGDLFMNLGVFMAMALSYYSKWPYYDPIFATGVAAVLLWSAYGITRESFDILMDKEIPAADREKILSLVSAHPDTRAVHDLRTRSTGERIFIEFHLELDGGLPLKKAHDITEQIEKILFDAFPSSEVLIHQEPAGLDDHRIDNTIPIKNADA